MCQETNGFMNVFQVYPNMFRQVVAIFRESLGKSSHMMVIFGSFPLLSLTLGEDAITWVSFLNIQQNCKQHDNNVVFRHKVRFADWNTIMCLNQSVPFKTIYFKKYCAEQDTLA
jgi:hypothetical protein